MDPLFYVLCGPSHHHSGGSSGTSDDQTLYRAIVLADQDLGDGLVEVVTVGAGRQTDDTSTDAGSSLHAWGTAVSHLAEVFVDSPAGPLGGVVEVFARQDGMHSEGPAFGAHDAQSTGLGALAFVRAGDTGAVIAAGASQDTADGSCTTIVFTTASSTPLPCVAEVPMLPQLPAIDAPI